jgi:hypothetical protein
MLAPAHVGHLAMLRALIRQSAAEGSFESNLATDSPQSTDFFEKLKRALSHGYFVEEDARTGQLTQVSVPGYVFWPDGRNSGTPPAGFGLFRALEDGYELWLAGLELGRRGDGHGRALIDALFATPQGKKTWIVRIPRESRYRAAVHHLLRPHGFSAVGDSTHLRWFIHENAPAALLAKVRGIVVDTASLNS